tara:strand:- start:9064 stop:9477 length:414 start_codon:yes stop_codon:yes gene_type:complete
MGKRVLVWVRATSRGQSPDGRWVDEGSAPFQVYENAVSKRWQVPVDKDEAAALDKTASANARAKAAKDVSPEMRQAQADIATAKGERDAVAEALAVSQGEVADLKAKITALEAVVPPPKSLMDGEAKKAPDKSAPKG